MARKQADPSEPAQADEDTAPLGRPQIWRGRYRRAMFDESVIAEAARRLSTAAPGAEVILFGSHARGNAGPGSDLDFLIVEPSVDDAVQEAVRLRRTLRGLGVFADVVVISEDEARVWRDVRGSLIHAALSEGRPLAA
jgi:predicted nucleotidyltransferase